MSPVSLFWQRPAAANVSQILTPRPPSFVAPSIWKLDVDTPHTNSGGQVPTCPLDCILAVSSDMSRLLERPVQSSSSFMTGVRQKRRRDERVGSTLDVTSPCCRDDQQRRSVLWRCDD